ncbi:hypothetical protein UUU_27050 (plasmid) [Klebsiella pneumoniae subsp. pneumoniae DSM 30104 = JCM 1662 = NBRC 14940]|nr:hypothetical protein UUU_27050 [Klebsiella pneumoniae subsp. pneumoniae DSM 30104 = JCM 1662 = NBRC 14940]
MVENPARVNASAKSGSRISLIPQKPWHKMITGLFVLPEGERSVRTMPSDSFCVEISINIYVLLSS